MSLRFLAPSCRCRCRPRLCSVCHCIIRADQRAGGRVLLLSTSSLTPPPLPSRLASSTHPAVSHAIVLPLPRISHGTARPDCCCVFAAPHLHCVSWPHPNTGRSPVRPIAVVVYLIRPNRGLTAVLLGKSTTTVLQVAVAPQWRVQWLLTRLHGDTALALSASAQGVPAPAALLVLKTLTEATAPCMLASFAPSRGHGPLGCPGRQRPLCLAGLSCCCSLPQA